MAVHRFLQFRARLYRSIYKQFHILLDKVDPAKMPRANVIPVGELERAVESIIKKNGDANHDKAVDTFNFEYRQVELTYWYKGHT